MEVCCVPHTLRTRLSLAINDFTGMSFMGSIQEPLGQSQCILDVPLGFILLANLECR
jgi:hypothetical protein